MKDLERAVKDAEKTVKASEKLILDLKVEASVTMKPELSRRLETKIARFTYRLNQEKQALNEAQERLRRTGQDFQVYAERNTL